jgi:ABC-type branched-subunit amino acid transport system ATPase component
MPDREKQPAALQVNNVTAGYGGKPIIHDVSMTVRSGEITVALGPNGAGKSTLLKAIMGVVRCSTGSILLGESEVRNLRTDELAKRGLAYVPQVRDVFGPLSIEENLDLGGYLVARNQLSSRIAEVFEVFPALASRRRQRADTLSGGERKMLAIGRVLMSHPAVLLLDEPTAGLAPAVAHEVLSEHVRRLASLQVAVLVVEQRAIEALAISDTAYIMVAGEVQASGPAAELAGRAEIGEMFLGRRNGDRPQIADE